MTPRPRFELTPPSLALAESIVTAVAVSTSLRRPGLLVVAVAGESGSGKSMTAAALAHVLGTRGIATAVIHQDDYFHLPPRTNHERRLEDLRHVGPQEVDMARIRRHLAEFRARRDVPDAPLVDYPANRFVVQQLRLAECEALVVEGTYALQLDDVDVRIFLEATHQETLERRRARNRDIDHPAVDEILAIEHRIIARQAAGAHVVVGSDFAIRHGG